MARIIGKALENFALAIGARMQLDRGRDHGNQNFPAQKERYSQGKVRPGIVGSVQDGRSCGNGLFGWRMSIDIKVGLMTLQRDRTIGFRPVLKNTGW